MAIINAITNWLVGLPLAGVFAFVTDDGVQGLWWGLVVASTLQVGAEHWWEVGAGVGKHDGIALWAAAVQAALRLLPAVLACMQRGGGASTAFARGLLGWYC